MNISKITNLSISETVKENVKKQHGSVRACADAFNLRHSDEIQNNGWKRMDKDFVQRICTNKFSVVTQRVSNLCTFLKIDLENQQAPTPNSFSKEFDVLEKVVQNNPNLVQTLRALLSNVADALTLNGAKDIS